MNDDERTIERLAVHLDELRALVARARRSGLTPAERGRLAELRDRLVETHAELMFLTGSDGEALRAIFEPPAGTV